MEAIRANWTCPLLVQVTTPYHGNGYSRIMEFMADGDKHCHASV